MNATDSLLIPIRDRLRDLNIKAYYLLVALSFIYSKNPTRSLKLAFTLTALVAVLPLQDLADWFRWPRMFRWIRVFKVACLAAALVFALVWVWSAPASSPDDKFAGLDSQTSSALKVAVVGGLVASGLLVLYGELEKSRQRKSLASGLLWEIDDFYKLSIRNINRKLKGANLEELRFDVKPLTFIHFTVYEGSADKVGLFKPGLVQGIVGWYGSARAYLDTIHDYGQTIEQIDSGQHQLHTKAVTLLKQIQGGAETLVPLTRTICEGLAHSAGAEYTFDVP